MVLRFLGVLMAIFPFVLSAQSSKNISLYFSSNSSQLEQPEIDKLQQLLDEFEEHKNYYQVKVFGYTDFKGLSSSNITLSRQRSAQVAEYLLDKGIRKDQLLHQGKGISIVSHNLAVNRRVDVQVFLPQPTSFSFFEDDETTQLFTIDPKKQQYLSFNDGTSLVIPANAFMDKRGIVVSDSVTVSFDSFRTLEDVIKSGIIMNYGNGALKTAGMFTLEGESNGQKVFVRPQRPLQVKFKVDPTIGSSDFFKLDSVTNTWSKLKPIVETQNKVDSLKRSEIIKNSVKRNHPYCWKENVEKLIPYLDLFDKPVEDVPLYWERFVDVNYIGEKHILKLINDPQKYEDQLHIKLHLLEQHKKKGLWFTVTFDKKFTPEFEMFKDVIFKYEGNSTEVPIDYLFSDPVHDIALVKRDEKLMLKIKNSVQMIDMPVKVLNHERMEIPMDKIDDSYTQYTSIRENRIKVINDSLKQTPAYQKYIFYEQTLGKKPKQLYSISSFFYKGFYKKHVYDDIKKNIGLNLTKGLRTRLNQALEETNFDSLYQVYYQLEWDKYQKRIEGLSQQEKLYLTFNIAGFGTYNADQVKRINAKVAIDVLYHTADGKVVQGVKTMLLDEDLGSVIYYQNGYMGYDAHHIAVSKVSKSKLFVITEDDKVFTCVLTPQIQETLQKGKEYNWLVKEMALLKSAPESLMEEILKY